jgi:hypothetical protein
MAETQIPLKQLVLPQQLGWSHDLISMILVQLLRLRRQEQYVVRPLPAWLIDLI